MFFERVILWVIVFSLFSSGCARVAFGPSEKERERRFQTNAIAINEDAPFTNKQDVTLKLFGAEEQEMYITNDPTCEEGGEWVLFSETQEWTLSQLNTEVGVYVRFRDEVTVSDCLSDTIIHDNIPPQLGFQRTPDEESNKSSDYFILGATDSLSGLSTYYCGDTNDYRECAERVELENLSEGTNNFVYFAEDRAGNRADPIGHQWLVDLTPPVLRWVETPQTLTTINKAHFEFLATDNYTGNPLIECDLNNFGFSPCTSPHDLTLPEGRHQLRMRSRDRVGNTSPTIVHNWIVDSVPPLVKIVEAPDRYTNQSVSRFKFLAVDENPQQDFECSIDRGGFISCQAEESFTLSEGEHHLSVRIKDLVGNVSVPATHQWGIDLTPPVVEITSKPDLLTSEVSARFTLVGTDSWTGIRWTYCGLDGVVTKCVSPVDYNNLSEGVHRFEAYAEDLAGNRSAPKVYEWEIDSIPPTVEITSGPRQWSNSPEAVLEFKGSDGSREISHYECALGEGPLRRCRSPDRVSGLAESSYVFQVIAYDRWGNPSPKDSHSWNVDLTPPVVHWEEIPNRHDTYTNSFAKFSASDAFSGVTESHCQINSTDVPCRMAQRFQTDYLIGGLNQMVVNVFDKAGNMSSLSHQWEVYSPYRAVTQSVVIDESSDEIDVLFVIDNSFSMRQEQRHLSRRIDNFVDHLDGLNWRMAVTSTAPNARVKGGDGKLVAFPNGEFHLDNTLDMDVAQEYLGETVELGASGGFFEQGIRATYRVIERAKNSDPNKQEENAPNREFLRESAVMAVAVLSDENESGDKMRNKAEQLIKFIEKTWGGKKSFVFHSIVVQDGDIDCLDGPGVSEGSEYSKLSRMTGGIIGSICSPDYSGQLSGIGLNVRNQISTIELECDPVDKDGDGSAGDYCTT